MRFCNTGKGKKLMYRYLWLPNRQRLLYYMGSVTVRKSPTIGIEPATFKKFLSKSAEKTTCTAGHHTINRRHLRLFTTCIRTHALCTTVEVMSMNRGNNIISVITIARHMILTLYVPIIAILDIWKTTLIL